jgi:hypothetical protein
LLDNLNYTMAPTIILDNIGGFYLLKRTKPSVTPTYGCTSLGPYPMPGPTVKAQRDERVLVIVFVIVVVFGYSSILTNRGL